MRNERIVFDFASFGEILKTLNHVRFGCIIRWIKIHNRAQRIESIQRDQTGQLAFTVSDEELFALLDASRNMDDADGNAVIAQLLDEGKQSVELLLRLSSGSHDGDVGVGVEVDDAEGRRDRGHAHVAIQLLDQRIDRVGQHGVLQLLSMVLVLASAGPRVLAVIEEHDLDTKISSLVSHFQQIFESQSFKLSSLKARQIKVVHRVWTYRQGVRQLGKFILK